MVKTHKRKKRSRLRGSKTAFYGARKKHKKSGHRGGIGMSGSGKRADQKKTLVLKLYGNEYFGKQGITSRGTEKNKEDKINIGDINSHIESFVRKGLAKKSGEKYELKLESYKILGEGEIDKKIMIKAKAASESAIEKVKKAGGEIVLEKK